MNTLQLVLTNGLVTERSSTKSKSTFSLSLSQIAPPGVSVQKRTDGEIVRKEDIVISKEMFVDTNSGRFQDNYQIGKLLGQGKSQTSNPLFQAVLEKS